MRYGINQLYVPTTLSEREDKKYNMNDIFRAARLLINGGGICVNAIRRLQLSNDQKFTIVELNQIVDEIVDDSNFYNR